MLEEVPIKYTSEWSLSAFSYFWIRTFLSFFEISNSNAILAIFDYPPGKVKQDKDFL
jgi:hypothetical protein